MEGGPPSPPAFTGSAGLHRLRRPSPAPPPFTTSCPSLMIVLVEGLMHIKQHAHTLARSQRHAHSGTLIVAHSHRHAHAAPLALPCSHRHTHKLNLCLPNQAAMHSTNLWPVQPVVALYLMYSAPTQIGRLSQPGPCRPVAHTHTHTHDPMSTGALLLLTHILSSSLLHRWFIS